MEAITRLQLLQQLEQKYYGKMVKYSWVNKTNSGTTYARVQQINCESDGGDDFIVIVQLDSRRIECSREKFEANTIVL